MQVDTEFKLKDIKETSRSWEGKTEGCKRELKELNKKYQEHIEQSVPILLCAHVTVCLLLRMNYDDQHGQDAIKCSQITTS